MIGKCKQCGYQAGFFGLKKGICEKCRNTDINNQPDKDIAIQKMTNNVLKREKKGADIAKDCLVNGLRHGEFVKLSDIDSLIKKNFSYDPYSTSTGFLQQMMKYIESGEIINIKMDDGDTVFVHKDHTDSLKNINS